MRKVLISLAVAGAAFVAASPAAAQYYPGQPYGYAGNGYNGYGHNNWGQLRSLQARIDNVERQINRLDRRDRIGERSANRLREEANRIERRLHDRARGGLDPREAGDIQYRIARLEQRVQVALNDRYGRYGAAGYNGYNGQLVDRDRDGRDDRWEGRDRDND